MSAILRKRADKLLSDHWSRAKPILPDAYFDTRAALRSVNDLTLELISHYTRTKPKDEIFFWQKIESLASGLPPIHKDFLSELVEHPRFRRDQWVMHHHPEIVEEETAFYTGFLAHVQTKFNLAGGLMAVAVPLFEEQTRQAIARYEYIGCDCPCDTEIVTRDKVLYCQIYNRVSDEMDVSEQMGAAYELALKQASEAANAEWFLTLYGIELTPAENETRNKLFAQMDADMSKGKPSSRSKAAMTLKAGCTRNPRLPQPYDKAGE